MFMITVAFGSTSCPLLFKTEEAAKAAWVALGIAPSQSIEQMRTNSAPDSPVRVADEFGREICVCLNQINGAIFEDLELSKEGQIEQALHQARTQAAAQGRAQTDPKLMAVNRQHGPAILSPMGASNGRGF